MADVLKQVKINKRFCMGKQEQAIQRALQRFEILDLRGSHSDYEHQLARMYDSERDWKYEPSRYVIDGIGIDNYHILVARERSKLNTVAGTVRAVFLPNSDLVYGSCLVVKTEFRGSELSLPLIYAAMSAANEDSEKLGKKGISGAVLGVDDNAKMRAFHSTWGVRYIHKDQIPFITPRITDRKETTRIIGLRLATDIETISSQELNLVLNDLMSFQLEIGYRREDVESVYAQMHEKIARGAAFRLVSAEEYDHATQSLPR